MEKDHLYELLRKYKSGLCNAEEKAIVENWFLTLGEEPTEYSEDEIEHSLEEIWEAMPTNQIPVKKINWPLRVATIAAAIVVMLGVWTLLFVKTPSQTDCNCDEDIKPGTNTATLTLPNGKKIDLSDVKNGELAIDQGVKIIKQSDGQLLYQFNPDAVKTITPGQRDSVPALVLPGGSSSNPLSGLNSLTTPKGGQYHIALPDGTNVWLNAGSTLKFPSTFEGLAERRVLLIGEAYFEVSHVKSLFGMQKRARKMPFIVKTATQEVTVLGTHFNINSYPDEPDTKTTLLEGAVGITAPLLQKETTILKPEDQAVNNGAEIKVKKVDTDLAVAWIKGEFMFRNEDLQSIMRKVARWYNVEVIYENKDAGNEMFGGTISRYDKISRVLNALEGTSNIRFKVTGRKVFVTRL
ncbi:FecR family protein [Pedobacter heparinus]|uniref:FecR protein n=1 Tax=Pedobacter heparinus (strain ATCC 13125 / DSM 2366 / CIP 104194 / JCM 7457 / NBRC 12017 / NCIMB 9290 / NRRL B-14731 / HIM 762-3) TaxID=485917 RepID=C6XUM2_PEDHD|nr:FecR family protein [Pedobacter heparinus]ACU03872.1 FecR protein [Pedobacter heparinus DSM 2366]